jgi:hypothetical protein
MDRQHFGTMIGKEVIIVSTVLFPDGEPLTATIRGSEAGGIWIESQKLTDLMLKIVLKTGMFEVTPIFFLPFSSMEWAFVLGEVPSISSEGIAE